MADATPTTKSCKMCLEDIPHRARICSHCGTLQALYWLRYLGASIPLMAATATTVLLLFGLVQDRWFPERALIRINPPEPRHSVDKISFEIANLSDLTVPMPTDVWCTIEGNERFLDTLFDQYSTDQNGRTYFIASFPRQPDSPAGLRNAAESVGFSIKPGEWNDIGADPIDGSMRCRLDFADRHGALDQQAQSIAFRARNGRVIFSNLEGILGSDPENPSPTMHFAEQAILELESE